jgi:hypothetical protein
MPDAIPYINGAKLIDCFKLLHHPFAPPPVCALRDIKQYVSALVNEGFSDEEFEHEYDTEIRLLKILNNHPPKLYQRNDYTFTRLPSDEIWIDILDMMFKQCEEQYYEHHVTQLKDSVP